MCDLMLVDDTTSHKLSEKPTFRDSSCFLLLLENLLNHASGGVISKVHIAIAVGLSSVFPCNGYQLSTFE